MLRTILVVDDDEITRGILVNMLISKYDIIEAENGQLALDILNEKSKTISAVILDVMMPIMDGYELLEIMKKTDKFSQIPVIIATSSDEQGSEIKALTVGANDFITKPYNPSVVDRRLWNLINLRETSAIVNAIKIDPLTGIYSRIGFFEKVSELIKTKEPGYYIIGSFDINHFKVINDQYGNEKGDQVLKEVAKIINKGFQKVGGFAGRLNEDCFSGIYPKEAVDSEAILGIYKDIANIDLSIPQISFSIGRYVIDDLTISPSIMYDRAVIAGTYVKGSYDTNIVYYNDEMRTKILQEQKIISEMEKALANHEFEIWLQPQYNHATKAIIGSEALVRWRHPEKGLIAPGIFIPIFETNGFIYELDKFVWEETCRLLRKWMDEGLVPLPISVNISRYDMFKNDIIDILTGLINKYQIPIELLRLEITESAFSESTNRIIEVAKKLISYGFTMEVDDFGSGYSSLNTLKDVPAQIVKLDMRFLEGKNNNDRGGNIIASIVRMIRGLEMSVIAEGVETIEQADFLGSIGCNYIQGYLYSRPVTVMEYEEKVKHNTKEEHLLAVEKIENYDNELFWDPNSMDTLIFNSYVGGACIFEYDHRKVRILRLNKKFLQILGDQLSSDDIFNINWSDHMSETKVNEIRKIIEDSIKTRSEMVSEIYFDDVDKIIGRVYMRTNIRMISKIGERYLFYCLCENITEQRRTEIKEKELSNHLKVIMNNVDGGISATTTSNGVDKIIFTNERFYSIFGYTKEQYAEEVNSHLDLVYPEDLQEYKNNIKQIYAGKSVSFKYRAIKRNGHIVYVRCNASLVKDLVYDFDMIVSVNLDITKLVQIEEALKNSNTQMRFLNSITHELLNSVDQNDGLKNALQKILDYFQGEHSIILEFNNVDKYISKLINIDNQGHVVDDDFNVQIEEFCDNNFFVNSLTYIDNLDKIVIDYPRQQKIFSYLNAKSMVITPLKNDNDMIGVLIVTNPQKHLTDNENILMLGEYIANIIRRQEINYKIEKDNENLLQMMNDTPGGYVKMKINDDGRIETLYANKVFCEARGLTFKEILEISKEDSINGVHPNDIGLVQEMIEKAIRVKDLINFNYRLLQGDGTYAWYNVSGRAIKNENDEVFINAYYKKLSTKEQNELSIVEVIPFLLKTIMKSSMDLTFAKDQNFKYICCSRGLANLIGIENEEDIIGKDDFELFDKEMANKFRQDDERIIRTGEAMIDVLENIPSNDNMPHFSKSSKYALKDLNGNVIGVYGISHDITESHAASEQLNLLVNYIPGGLGSFEIENGIIKMIYYNEGFYDFSGFTKEEYDEKVRKDALAFVVKEDIPAIREAITRLLNGEKNADCEYRHMNKDGSISWINLRGIIYDNRKDKMIINVVQFNVTDKKHNEEMRLLHEQEIKMAINQIGKIVCEYNPVTNELLIPEQYANETGLSTRITIDPHHPEQNFNTIFENANVIKNFYKSIMNKEKEGNTIVTVANKDGSKKYELLSFINMFDRNNKINKTIILIEDITEQIEIKHQYEHELQLRKNLMADAFSYYEFNIITGMVNEFVDKINPNNSFKNVYVSEKTRKAILERVYEKDQKLVENMFFEKALKKMHENGKNNLQVNYRHIFANNEVKWCQANVNIIEKPENKDVIAFIYICDIDRLKKDEIAVGSIIDKEIQTMGIISASTGIAHIIKNTNALIDMKKNVDFKYDEYVQKIINKSIDAENKQPYITAFALDNIIKILKNKDSHNESYSISLNPHEVLRKSVLYYYLDGTHQEIVLTIRDITDIYNEELRQRQILQKAMEEANASSQAKCEFLSRMSHDIRTPMNAIIGMVNLAKNEVDRKIIEGYLDNINTSSHFLLGLINDVLDLNTLESGNIKFNPEPLDMDEFTANINNVIKPLMDEKNIEFIYQMDNRIKCINVDKLRYIQIFFNLLSNSVKYTPNGGKVEFISEVFSETDDKLGIRYIVKDNGRGMSEHFVHEAFEPFVQEKGRSNSELKGSGLGLAIVKNIVESMNGTVTLKSVLGVGTEFQIELYCQKIASPKKNRNLCEYKDLNGLHILVVDDNEMNLLVAEMLLVNQKCIVDEANNGLEALQRFEQSPCNYYDLIIMDLRMPVMNGFEASEAIRNLKRDDAKTVQIIALTADLIIEDEISAKKSGMNAQLTKPIEPNLLYEMILRLIGKK